MNRYCFKADCECDLDVDEAYEQGRADERERIVRELEKIGTSYCTEVNCNNECYDCDHGCLMGAIIATVERGGENE